MPNKIDLPKFHAALEQEFVWLGRRIKDLPGSCDPEIVAAAIVSSALHTLTHMAGHKVLGPKDLQITYDSFMKSAGMETYEDHMGAVIVRRV